MSSFYRRNRTAIQTLAAIAGAAAFVLWYVSEAFS